ncbi:MAG: ribokinase [Pannonibacter phragmitetus]
MITVFGSINLDLVAAVERLPLPGETAAGPDHQNFPGGKGANQALAARRAGADVAMTAAVGTDVFAAPALANLEAAGVDLSGVRRLDGATGIAMIGVEASGENLIIVASGVNARVSASWLKGKLPQGTLLLMQMETPAAEIRAAIAAAREAGATVILNTAPAGDPAVSELASLSDIVIANESEAMEIAGKLGLPGEPEAFVRTVAEGRLGTARLAVVTLGAKGVIAHDGTALYNVPTPKVRVVDTTGAGDAFCGAFAAALDRGDELGAALAFGVAAGSLACTANGAQGSAPDAAAIRQLAATLPITRSLLHANTVSEAEDGLGKG